MPLFKRATQRTEYDILRNMKKQWKVSEKYPASYGEEIQGDDLTLQMLFHRGIQNQEQAEKFFHPDYTLQSHDPFLLPDMEKAVTRILDAMDTKEHILVFGDYDADGVCASVALSDFFSFAGYENVTLYNPDRYKEGYGISEVALEAIFGRSPKLVITVDTGIGNKDAIEKLQEKEIDVIVIDHHLVSDGLPPAYAVIDHQRKDSKYPFPYLCGTGLAFKTVQALCKKRVWPFQEGYEKWILDLVAIATIADMVPLRDENRAFAYWGIEVMKKNRRFGLKELMKAVGIDAQNISAQDIAYTIAPLINSAGRMDHANTAVELLRTENESEASWLAGRLIENNNKRKDMVKEIIFAVEQELQNIDLPDVVVLGKQEWHPGVLGIAAGKVVETYARPAFIFGKGEGSDFKGSGRSDGSVNLVELMKRAGEELFSAFGGHAMAAGFTLAPGREKEFAQKIQGAYRALPKEANLFEDLEIEKEFSLDDVDWNTYALISRFEPFGQGNPRPSFLFKDCMVKNVRLFGNGGAHIEFMFQKSNNEPIKAIQFGAVLPDTIRPGVAVDVVASLEHSTYNGSQLRLRMVDYKSVLS